MEGKCARTSRCINRGKESNFIPHIRVFGEFVSSASCNLEIYSNQTQLLTKLKIIIIKGKKQIILFDYKSSCFSQTIWHSKKHVAMSDNFNALLKHGYKSVHYVKAHLVAKCFNQHHKLDYV